MHKILCSIIFSSLLLTVCRSQVYYSYHFSYSSHCIISLYFAKQKNDLIFRRWESKVLDHSYFEHFTFNWRPVAPNTIILNITAHRLLRDIHHLDVHFVLFHRYATWQKFLVDVWENACDAIAGRVAKAPVFSIVYNNFKAYTNILHPCPFRVNETVYVASDRINFNRFFMPLVPSGAYRIDFNFTDGPERHPFLFMQVHGDISDHRVWVH